MDIHPEIYHRIIDPLLKSSRERIYKQVPEKSTVLDIACGTGALVNRLADKCQHVTGADLHEGMIRFARKKKKPNTEFSIIDARELSSFVNKKYDIVIMSMAYHQFDPDDRFQILKEAGKVASTIILSDYAYPDPSTMKQITVHTIERLAGRMHYRNFTSYRREGGISAIAERYGLRLVHEEASGSGVFQLGVFECSIPFKDPQARNKGNQSNASHPKGIFHHIL